MKLSVLFFVACCSALAQKATASWNTGDNGIQWKMNCDFKGNDLLSIKAQGSECGNLCFNEADCTHFTWTDFEDGTCWLKKANNFNENNTIWKGGAVCGFRRDNGENKPNPPRPGTCQRGGVCYDPMKQNHGDYNSILEDMKFIKRQGFSHVRTFTVHSGNVNLAQVIGDAGLTATLGIPFNNHNGHELDIHLSAAIEAANKGYVSHIMVGNENLAHVDYIPHKMYELIGYLKSKTPAHVKIGTAQRTTELSGWRKVNGLENLLNNCDVVGVNIHPFFTPNLNNPKKRIDNMKGQWNQVLNKQHTNRGKFIITEAGWPTAGYHAGNEGSIESASAMYRDYANWATFLAPENKYYFQMFDTPYKGPVYEKNFGMSWTNRGMKFSLQCPK